jgi:hypothetical protein
MKCSAPNAIIAIASRNHAACAFHVPPRASAPPTSHEDAGSHAVALIDSTSKKSVRRSPLFIFASIACSLKTKASSAKSASENYCGDAASHSRCETEAAKIAIPKIQPLCLTRMSMRGAIIRGSGRTPSGSMSLLEREGPGENSYAVEAKKVHSGPFGQPSRHRCVVQVGRLRGEESSWTGESLLAPAWERSRWAR